MPPAPYRFLTEDQVDSFLEVMHHENNRPVRPVNARPILQ